MADPTVVAALSHCMQSTAKPVVKTLVGYICDLQETSLLCIFFSNCPYFRIRIKKNFFNLTT